MVATHTADLSMSLGVERSWSLTSQWEYQAAEVVEAAVALHDSTKLRTTAPLGAPTGSSKAPE